MQSSKAQTYEVGGHTAEGQKQIWTFSMWINHIRSVQLQSWLINTILAVTKKVEGRGGLKRDGGLITFYLWKGGLLERRGAYSRGGGNRGFWQDVLLVNYVVHGTVQITWNVNLDTIHNKEPFGQFAQLTSLYNLANLPFLVILSKQLFKLLMSCKLQRSIRNDPCHCCTVSSK